MEIERQLSVDELRIGNFIDWERTTHIVTGLLKTKDKSYGRIYSNWFKGLDEKPYIGPDNQHLGIWLYDEYLLMFGFKYLDVVNIWLKDDVYLELLSYDSKVFAISVNNTLTTATVEFVHELQNLWFALKGEELTYDLKYIDIKGQFKWKIKQD
jgi:hypothetical protein